MALGEEIDIDNPTDNGGYVVSEDWEPRVWRVAKEWNDTTSEFEYDVLYREETGRQTYRYKGKTLAAVQNARNDVLNFVPTETPGYSRALSIRSWISNDKTDPKAYDAEITINVRYAWRNDVPLEGNTLRT